ncbi:MAG TPA: methyltransferase domain-containing protein [Terriglobales bacterium]|jgi:ubiquinone/menaquinone biosynthesis C-methylase UbiE|nr:methyltransferase domain-containing protein [Terriglobales bacterium]
MKRVVIPELLDTDSGTPAEVADSLADLHGINHRFGGVDTTEAMVARVARQVNAKSLSLLEVAAGTGYVPATVQQRLCHRGLQLDVTLLDRAPSHLGNGVPAVVGDALELPFQDASFDLLSCNLFAHHLSPEELLQFAGEGLRVCRIALLINDLVRHPLHLALVYAAVPLFRSRLTRHDGPASVRRAYTPEELRALLAQTRAARVEIHRHYLYRMGVIAWKS